ncbi:hypothetical protein HII13_004064 [Brettanomyces bruxellensis]|nr:hypothetical protein HII13_004064 [Brettanomyces bruxellensis]
MSLSARYYISSIHDAALKEKYTAPNNLTIPLKEEGEEVVIDANTDLPEDSSELCTLLTNEECKPEYWLLVAKAYANKEKYDEALNVVKQASQTSLFGASTALDNFIGWLQLGRYSKEAESGDSTASEHLSEAISKSEACLSSVANDEPATLLKAVGTMASKHQKGRRSNLDKESRLLDTLLRKHPDNCYALLGKAKIFFYRESYAGALKLFQKVLMLNPLLLPDPRIGIGLCYWFLDRKDLASRAWRNSVLVHRHNNTEGKLLTTVAKFDECFTSAKSDEQFCAMYKEAVEFAEATYREGRQVPAVQVVLAALYFLKGEYMTCSRVCDGVIARPGHVASFVRSDALFWKARCCFVQAQGTAQGTAQGHDQIRKAQRLFSEAVKLNEANTLARMGLGQCLTVRKQYSDAIRCFEKVQKQQPLNMHVNYALGALYARSRRFRKQAVDHLTKYVNLCSDRREPISVNALFTLSRLYESTDMSKSLSYLQMAKRQELELGKSESQVSYALLNNIGVLEFLSGLDSSREFELATEALSGEGGDVKDVKDVKDEEKDLKDEKKDLKDEEKGVKDEENGVKQTPVDSSNASPSTSHILTLKALAANESTPSIQKASAITLQYNMARSKESTGKKQDIEDSMQIYEQILQECPHYSSARIRWLLLACVSQDRHIVQELERLLHEEPDNLEVRAFYGWYLKNYGKKHEISSNKGLAKESEIHKETLVKLTSHDQYALISLANVYCTLAREMKDAKKKSVYYVRSAQLYQKVLMLDPKNVYAAQGIAIILAQRRQPAYALEIFRKARDSLSNKNVYVNLGHCLLESRQYGKAIENYRLALDKFTDGRDAHLNSLLARAWLARGAHEHNLDSMAQALAFSEAALSARDTPAHRYNVAFVQYQRGDLVRKAPAARRTVRDLQDCLAGVREATGTLERLAQGDGGRPPYPVDDLSARAQMGKALAAQLEKEVGAQRKYEAEQSSKIAEAKKRREEEQRKVHEEKMRREEERQRVERKMAEQRRELDRQQQEWNKKRLEEAQQKKSGIEASSESGKAARGSRKRRGGKEEKDDFVVSDSDSNADAGEEYDSGEEEKEEEELFGEPSPKKRRLVKEGKAFTGEVEKNEGEKSEGEKGDREKNDKDKNEADDADDAAKKIPRKRANRIVDNEDEE